MISRIAAIVVAALVLTCVGCESTPPQQDAEYQAPKIYRTGSNIPTKDYGAENIEVSKPNAADSTLRPGASVLGRKPGG